MYVQKIDQKSDYNRQSDRIRQYIIIPVWITLYQYSSKIIPEFVRTELDMARNVIEFFLHDRKPYQKTRAAAISMERRRASCGTSSASGSRTERDDFPHLT